VPRVTTSARRRLDGPWTRAPTRWYWPPYPATRAELAVVLLPTFLLLVCVAVLLFALLR
jgi:hypothetical protein